MADNGNDLTTIQVKKSSVEILKSKRIHEKQPLYEVVIEILGEKK